MGEYARVGGHEVKIGTCEDMYYLRYEQRHDVEPVPGNVDPARDAAALRFRFPWPDEDHVAPGGEGFHERYSRAVAIDDVAPPAGVAHEHVQFVARAGYLVGLPCPESSEYADHSRGRQLGDLIVHRNGFPGAVLLVAQKFVAGIGLVPVLRCGGCGAMWREEYPTEIERLAVACRSRADLEERRGGRPEWWHAIADRILEGAGLAALSAG